MKLIPNARAAWRMLSVRLAAAAVAFGALDPVSQAGILSMLHIPADRVTAVMGLAIIVARLIDQPKTREEGRDDHPKCPARRSCHCRGPVEC